LFISCQIAEIRLEQITRALLPFFAVLLIDLIIISYTPGLSLWLPSLTK